MDLGIEDQVAVITGAGGGIGRETALAMAAEGARVVVWDLDARKADAVSGEIRDQGCQSISVLGSVANSSDVSRAIEQVIDAFGTIHILVNNAGFSDDARLPEMTDEKWHRVIDVCLGGAFFCSRAVSPCMITQQYGRIVNVGSRGHLGVRFKANYCAAKAGLHGLTRSMAIELGPSNITVNTVHPGVIPTPRVAAQDWYLEINEAAQQNQVIKRQGTPADVVNVILFYVSARSGFITGNEIFASGGRFG